MEIIKPIANYLKDKPFLLNKKITYLDLYLYELLNLILVFDEESSLFTEYPYLKKYMANIEKLPNMRDFLNSTKNEQLHFHDRTALLNTN
jgi:glutathione S-transferase